MKPSRKKVILLLIVVLSCSGSKAQWLALPNPPSSFTGSNNLCMNQVINPQYILPIADGKIIYTSLCTSSSIHQSANGSIMMSSDNLNSSVVKYNLSPILTEVSSFNNNTEMAYYQNDGSGNYSLRYSPNSLSTATSVSVMVWYPAATAITPSYVYGVCSTNSVVVQRYDKLSGAVTSSLTFGFLPVKNKLHFINDSVGFALALFNSNSSKTALVKISNFGLNWQSLLVDSLNPFVDFQVTPTGELYTLKANGEMNKSANYGVSFTALTPAPSGTYTCLHFANNLTGFVGGENGVLLKTKDSGASWTTETSNTSDAISSIQTFNYSSYFVTGTNKVFISQQPVGLSEKPQDNSALSLFPNPAADELTVNYTSNAGEVALLVSDISGKELIGTRFTGSSKLDISELSAGIYFVTVRDNNQILAIKKLIVSN